MIYSLRHIHRGLTLLSRGLKPDTEMNKPKNDEPNKPAAPAVELTEDELKVVSGGGSRGMAFGLYA